MVERNSNPRALWHSNVSPHSSCFNLKPLGHPPHSNLRSGRSPRDPKDYAFRWRIPIGRLFGCPLLGAGFGLIDCNDQPLLTDATSDLIFQLSGAPYFVFLFGPSDHSANGLTTEAGMWSRSFPSVTDFPAIGDGSPHLPEQVLGLSSSSVVGHALQFPSGGWSTRW